MLGWFPTETLRITSRIIRYYVTWSCRELENNHAPCCWLQKTLLFSGEGLSGGPVFRAHDKATGETIAELELPATVTGLPITYRYEGRQYIVVAVGARGYPAGLVALALPD